MNKEEPMNKQAKMVADKDQNTPPSPSTTSTDQRNDHSVIDTSIIDQQWDELTRDWQAQPYEKTDISALLKQTEKRTRWAKTCFGLNILATLIILIAFAYGVVTEEFDKLFNTFLGAGGVMSLVFVYYEIKIRAKAWSQLNASPDQAIENALAGYQSSLKYMSLTKWSCVPFGILGNWFTYAVAQQSGKSILFGMIFINTVLIITFLVTEFLYRKRKKEYRELLAKTANL